MPAIPRVFVSAYHHGEVFFERTERFFEKTSILCPILGTLRKILKIIGHFLKDRAEYAKEYAAIKAMRSTLFDVHVILVWPRAPVQFAKAYLKSVKIVKSLPGIYRQWRQTGEIPRKELLKTAMRILYVLNHVAGGINKGIIKPLKVIDKYANLGEFSSSFGKGVKIFSIVRRGGKICYLTGKILQGKKVKKRLIQLCFQFPALIFDAFEIANVRINPLFRLSFGLLKSVLELATCWQKTA